MVKSAEAAPQNYQNMFGNQWAILTEAPKSVTGTLPVHAQPEIARAEKKWVGTVKFITIPKEEPKPPLPESKPEQSMVSPFFDLQKSVDLYRKLVDVYGPKRGQEIALQVFIGDVRSQLWELRETPMPFQYRMYL